MSTAFLPCGCAISRSMFGNREILSVMLCGQHTLSPEIQAKLREVIELIGQIEVPDAAVHDM